METIKAYKIRRKSDGLFSTGGSTPRFTSVGKTWGKLSHLKNHLKVNGTYEWTRDEFPFSRRKSLAFERVWPQYVNCEIIELTYTVSEQKTTDVAELFNIITIKD